MLQRYPLKLFLMPLCRLWEREKRKAPGTWPLWAMSCAKMSVDVSLFDIALRLAFEACVGRPLGGAKMHRQLG